MVPTTRSARFQTPPEPLAGREATTTRKYRFFDVLARDGSTKSLYYISKDCGIDEKTGRNWRDQYMNIGSLAQRSTRQRSSILGYKSKVTKSIAKMLVSPSRNPVRKQLLEVQILYYNIPVQKCQLQCMLKRHTKGGGRYLCTFVKKAISTKNR